LVQHGEESQAIIAATLADSDTKLSAARSEVSSLKKTVESLERARGAHESQVEEAERRRQASVSEVERMQGEMIAMQRKVDGSDMRSRDLTNQVSALKSQIFELERS